MEPEGSLPHSQVPATWARSIRSIPLHPTYWRYILILFSHLRLGLSSRLFPQVFPTKTLYTSPLSAIRATCPPYLILFDLITRTILGEQYRLLSSSLRGFIHFPVTSSLLSTHNPLTTLFSNTLSNPQPTFLPHCHRPSFIPIQNNRQNYNSVYLDL